MALVKLIDTITSAIDRKQIVLGVFFDFSKAFDTVHFEVLFKKLEVYGIRHTALNWIKSYLDNLQQFVTYNKHKSEMEAVTCGVLQGYILGPLLFLLYINDMASVSTKLLPILYADDTNVFLEGKDIELIIHFMNEELSKLCKWLQCNRLSLNINKTNFMLFASNKKKISRPLNPLRINSSTIEEVFHTKFLGVTIDSQLNWKKHCNNIINKVIKGIGILGKERRLLNDDTLTTLYYSLIYPYLTYCIEVWGNTHQTTLKKLLILQKKVARIISYSHYLANSDPLFTTLKILPVSKLYVYLVALFMFKYHHNLLPDIFSDMFSTNNTTHDYDTQFGKDLQISSSNLTLRSKTINARGVKIRNFS